MRKLKEIIMQKMFSQYDDPNLWIDKYVNNPSVSDDELKHLRAVMQRDLALKKADSERIHELVGMFPPKLRPELLRSSVNQLRSKNPAVPGSGLVSVCEPVIPSVNKLTTDISTVDPYFDEVREPGLHAGVFPKCKIPSKISKLCPLCMRKYSPLLEKYNCLKCGSHVCQKCAYKVSQPDPITLCKECWDIAICYCKTGDWFNQYLESKLPNPLRIDITFTPLQTSNLKASFDQLPEEESTWRRETSALLFKESKCCFKIEDEESNKNHNISSSDKSPRKQIQENSATRSNVLHPSSLPDLNSAEALKSSKETVKSKQLTKSPPSSPFRRPTLLPSKTFAFMNKPSLLTRDTDDAKESFKGKHHGAEVDGTKSGTESSKSENSGNFSAVDESQGEIDVSMEYNVQGNQLAIMLWALRNLTIRKRILGILHSTIRLLPENTKYDLKLPHPEKRNGLYSNYLRSVCFLVHTSDLNKKMVLIQIWFKKGITSRKLIGESFIPVKEYNMILGHKQTFHLFKGKDSISNVPLNSTYYGEIKVALRFAISVNQKRMVRIAEEAIDLCGTLEVWIKEGMNLISPISGRDVNLFVTVSLTDGNENTEYRSTDCVQRSDQPFWNSILRFSNQHLSDIYESKLKITIWNRINSFKPAEQLGVVKICTKGREYDFKTLLTADDDEGVSQCSTKKSNASLWEAVQSKPGTWVEQILKVHAPISK